MCYVDTHHTDM